MIDYLVRTTSATMEPHNARFWSSIQVAYWSINVVKGLKILGIKLECSVGGCRLVCLYWLVILRTSFKCSMQRRLMILVMRRWMSGMAESCNLCSIASTLSVKPSGSAYSINHIRPCFTFQGCGVLGSLWEFRQSKSIYFISRLRKKMAREHNGGTYPPSISRYTCHCHKRLNIVCKNYKQHLIRCLLLFLAGASRWRVKFVLHHVRDP